MLLFCGPHVPVLIYPLQRHARYSIYNETLLAFDDGDSSRLVITAPQAKLLRNLDAAIFAKLRSFRMAFVSELFDSRLDVRVRVFIESICSAINVWISQIGEGEREHLRCAFTLFRDFICSPKNISANIMKRCNLAANSDTLETQDRK